METKKKELPFLQGWLPWKGSVSTNLFAGITLAALAVPEVMGYTKISGTPVITGLYTMLIPMAVYALFGSSRHLVVGADSATAAILAAGLAGIALPRSNEWLALAGLLALLSAAFLFLARLTRLGFLANFLSRTVLIGFLSGVGIQVALREVPGLLGLSAGGHENLFDSMNAVFQQIGQASPVTLAISAGVIALIAGSRRLSKKIPGAMIAVIGSIVLSWVFQWPQNGVAVLGPVPSGLPQLGLPAVAWSWPLIQKLIPTAFAMFVVILAQSAATSRAYAEKYNEKFNENVDLVGLGLANIGAAFSGTFVVNGSPTKTQMVDSAGGSSQAAQTATVLAVLLVLLFLTGPLSFMPTAVLSAVVFLIGVELIDFKGMKRVFVERPYEFWVALATALAVVFVGVEQSILLAIVLSLVVHTRHGYLVRNVLLVSDDRGWHQRKIDDARQAAPGLIIYRFLHNLYYANAHVLQQDVAALVAQADPALSWFCVDLVAVNDVDFTAAETLRSLHAALSAQGVRVVFSELADAARREFLRSGLVELFGEDSFFETIDDVLQAYNAGSGRRNGS
jgi:high affinity sulfate transporter 1